VIDVAPLVGPKHARSWLVVAMIVLALPSSSTATVPADLCTGNPCVVSGAHTVDPDSNLDFGSGTDLVFASNAVVSTSGVRLTARSITMQSGARISGDGTSCGDTELVATGGDVTMQGTGGSAARIQSTGGCPGTLTFDATGNVTIGNVNLHGTGYGQYNFGGTIFALAEGSITTTGTLKTDADGTFGASGQITLEGRTGVVVNGPIDGGSPYEGSHLAFTSFEGDIVINGDVDTSAGLEAAFNTFNASGSIVFAGRFLGLSKAGFGGYCGGGAFMSVEAGESVTLSGPMDLTSSGGSGCTGGHFFAQAGTTFTQLADGDFKSLGIGAYGSGGNFGVQAAGDVSLRDIDVGKDGFVDVATSGGAVQVLGLARGGASGIQGCDVFVAAAGKLDMRSTSGSFTSNSLVASESITIAGKVLSLSDNDLTLREGAPLITGQVLPPPSISTNPSLPDCRPGPSCTPGGSCGDGAVQCGEQCDDGAANGTPPSRCTATCTEIPPALRIPGGGTKPFDCPYEWSAELSTVAADGSGLPKIKQSCTDNDPACDFDPSVGRCRLHLWGCAAGADARLPCAATSVSAVQATAPKLTSSFPFEVAARQALDAALAAFAGGVVPGEVCSDRFDVDVAAGGRVLKLQTEAVNAGPKDIDKLELTCAP